MYGRAGDKCIQSSFMNNTINEIEEYKGRKMTIRWRVLARNSYAMWRHLVVFKCDMESRYKGEETHFLLFVCIFL